METNKERQKKDARQRDKHTWLYKATPAVQKRGWSGAAYVCLVMCVCVFVNESGEWVGLQTASGPVRSSVRLCPVCLTRDSLAHGNVILRFSLRPLASTQDALITHHIRSTLQDVHDQRRHGIKVRVWNWATPLFSADPASLLLWLWCLLYCKMKMTIIW